MADTIAADWCRAAGLTTWSSGGGWACWWQRPLAKTRADLRNCQHKGFGGSRKILYSSNMSNTILKILGFKCSGNSKSSSSIEHLSKKKGFYKNCAFAVFFGSFSRLLWELVFFWGSHSSQLPQRSCGCITIHRLSSHSISIRSTPKWGAKSFDPKYSTLSIWKSQNWLNLAAQNQNCLKWSVFRICGFSPVFCGFLRVILGVATGAI